MMHQPLSDNGILEPNLADIDFKLEIINKKLDHVIFGTIVLYTVVILNIAITV
jgi:hypothetical protein